MTLQHILYLGSIIAFISISIYVQKLVKAITNDLEINAKRMDQLNITMIACLEELQDIRESLQHLDEP